MAKGTKTENVEETKVKKPKAAKTSAAAKVMEEEPPIEEDNIFVTGGKVQSSKSQNLTVLQGGTVEEPEGTEFPAPTPETQALREHILSIFETSEKIFWEMSLLFHQVNTRKLYQTWGYQSFKEYIQGEFAMHQRKGQFLMQIAAYWQHQLKEIFKDHPSKYKLLTEFAQEIGYSKARHLAKFQVITPDNAEVVMQRIRECKNDDEVQNYCRNLDAQFSLTDKTDKDDSNKVDMVKFLFNMMKGQEAECNEAVELAMSNITAHNREVTKSEGFYHLCIHYLTTRDRSRSKGERMRMLLSQVERDFGISITAFDNDTQKITFGKDTLEKVAADPKSSGDFDSDILT